MLNFVLQQAIILKIHRSFPAKQFNCLAGIFLPGYNRSFFRFHKWFKSFWNNILELSLIMQSFFNLKFKLFWLNWDWIHKSNFFSHPLAPKYSILKRNLYDNLVNKLSHYFSFFLFTSIVWKKIFSNVFFFFAFSLNYLRTFIAKKNVKLWLIDMKQIM